MTTYKLSFERSRCATCRHRPMIKSKIRQASRSLRRKWNLLTKQNQDELLPEHNPGIYVD